MDRQAYESIARAASVNLWRSAAGASRQSERLAFHGQGRGAKGCGGERRDGERPSRRG
jgi:hypothetical protein